MVGMDLAPVLTRYLARERDTYIEAAQWISDVRKQRIRANAATPLELPHWAFWIHGNWNHTHGLPTRPVRQPADYDRVAREGGT
ncbi:MAG: hypothetical protein HOQ24_04885 [Mycobacteriaceae bacterium]|nr:hypothetical protein [Mycobacteriaceae bacterium]